MPRGGCAPSGPRSSMTRPGMRTTGRRWGVRQSTDVSVKGQSVAGAAEAHGRPPPPPPPPGRDVSLTP